MKRLAFLFVLPAVVLLATGCGGSAKMFEGTWELVDAGGDPPNAPSTKVLNADHFAFGGETADGRVWAGGGTYRVEDGKYIETVEYHSIPALVGKSLIFDFRLDGDRWYHSGDFEAGGRKFHIQEVWKRVDE